MAETTAPAAAALAAKPPKPSKELFDEQLVKAEKEYNDAMARYNAIRAKIEATQPGKNKDSQNPTQKRRQELIAQANEIRQKQAGSKNARGTKLEQVKRLDEQLRNRIAEQKAVRGKVPFKSAEDIDREIDRLDRLVSGGTLKLVDERKTVAEISSLRKLRKNFSQFDDAEKQIDDLRSKIKAIKDSMDDPETKALSETYKKVQTELDAIKAEQDEAYKNLSGLRDERSKLQAEQQQKYQAVRKLKDEYYSQKKAFEKYERDARQRAWERQQAERDRIAKERKMERAQKMLAEASDPAYLEDIRRANSLLRFFDPSSFPQSEKSPLLADKGLSAQAQRKVDDSGLAGKKLVRKEDRDDEYLPAAKKGGRKGKKAAAAEPSKFFNCPPSVIEDCAFVGVDPPMAASDVPAVVEKVKAKLDHWKADQPEQTKRNIEKAKKEIERLEAAEVAETNGTKSKKSDDKKADDKEVSEVTSTLEETSVEGKKEEETKA